MKLTDFFLSSLLLVHANSSAWIRIILYAYLAIITAPTCKSSPWLGATLSTLHPTITLWNRCFVVPIEQAGKLRHDDMKRLAWAHAARRPGSRPRVFARAAWLLSQLFSLPTVTRLSQLGEADPLRLRRPGVPGAPPHSLSSCPAPPPSTDPAHDSVRVHTCDLLVHARTGWVHYVLWSSRGTAQCLARSGHDTCALVLFNQ